MNTACIGDVTLEYQVSGTGEPVVFIHGALIADSFHLLLEEPRLFNGYKLIAYHRRGYVGSTRTFNPMSIAQQAADCRALVKFLNAERAHIVGHSYGGCIALQLALDAPGVVHSLALLEPALFGGTTGQSYRDSLVRGKQRYSEVPAEDIVDEFLGARFGAGYRSALEQALPGTFGQAVADSATAFTMEISPLLEWNFGEAEARRITQPVLNVLGEESEALWPRFGEVYRLVQNWFPHVESFVLPGAAHGLQIQNPDGMAEALANFWRRHPIKI